MNTQQIYEQLLSSELDFAHFNALRTTVQEDHLTVKRGATKTFDYLLDSSRPTSSYYNRAIARCFTSFSEASLQELPVEIVSLELTPQQLSPELSLQLIMLGFSPTYQLCYLGAQPKDDLPLNREVVRLTAAQTDLFFDLLQLEGVDFPLDKRIRKKSYYCTEQFPAYVVKDGKGNACGWASIYVNGDTAFFGNAFILPEYRQAGAHSALLSARLNAVAQQGLKVAYTDVKHGSQSHYNCERAGFRVVTVNTIWTRKI